MVLVTANFAADDDGMLDAKSRKEELYTRGRSCTVITEYQSHPLPLIIYFI